MLDSPSAGLTDRPPIPSEPIRQNAGGPVDPGAWPSSGARTTSGLPPPAPRQALMPPAADQGVRVANLSPPPNTAQPAVPFAVKPAPVAAAPVKSPVATDGSIEVQPGDTLYGLSKKHGVSIAALMEANQLSSPNLRPGQKLALPQKPTPGQPKKPLVRPAVATAAPAPAPASTAASPANWDGSYTLKPGDSLYAVARRHSVPLAELQRVNNISEPLKLRPGTTLKVPAGGSPTGVAASPSPTAPAVIAAKPAAPSVASLPPRVVAKAPIPPVTGGAPIASGGAVTPKIINASPLPSANETAEQKVASLGGAGSGSVSAPVNDADVKPAKTASESPSTGPKFRWPVKGKVISEFGKRSDGTHNDGVNIAVPAGTDVHAVEGGTVAYAGSELKGYGNLVLIRHDNGWVSAYAHSDQVMVKRGDTIKRGQVIAKAGKTGTVDQPQVHFELRQGSKPVDPLPHMERN
jgi:murein DD-endopeptidase MepM/ murein hydrolase activator NlpD